MARKGAFFQRHEESSAITPRESGAAPLLLPPVQYFGSCKPSPDLSDDSGFSRSHDLPAGLKDLLFELERGAH